MERRSFVRVPLDIPVFARMEVEGQPPCQGTIVNLSRGGVQLALPTAPEDNLLGASVIVSGLPAAVDPSGVGCGGTVCWVASFRCGIQFTHPLPVAEDDLDALFR